MKYVIIILVLILLIAHQDYWNWDNQTMVWGFMPMGLFYHVIISLLAALLWLVTVTLAWPVNFSEPAAESQPRESLKAMAPSRPGREP